MVQGLSILYPEDDEYKGKFYVYGDDQTTISTEKTMKLIADYITVESQTIGKQLMLSVGNSQVK